MAKKIKTIADLTPDAANLNKGTERGRYLLETSVSKLGLGRSVLADKNGTLIAGNKTTEVAGELGMSKVRVIETDGTELIVVQRTDLDMTDPDDPRARQLAFADNQVGAQNLAWDAQALLAAAQADDLSDFVRDDELKAMIESAQEEESNTGGNDNVDAEPQIDKAEELRKRWGVEIGQLWELGNHRLLCGDSANKSEAEKVMGGVLADMVITDPPYGVAYVGKTKDALTVENDDVDESQLSELCKRWFDSADAVSRAGAYWVATVPPGPLHGVFFNDWKQRGYLRQVMVWNKDSMVLGHSEYHYKHEPILFGWKPGERLKNDDRTKTTVWDFPRPKASREHPTMKPVEMWAYAIRNHTKQGDTVFEPFSGSGTTIIACEQLGRKCRAIEISPAYVAVALQRWADATGKTPKLLQ